MLDEFGLELETRSKLCEKALLGRLIGVNSEPRRGIDLRGDGRRFGAGDYRFERSRMREFLVEKLRSIDIKTSLFETAYDDAALGVVHHPIRRSGRDHRAGYEQSRRLVLLRIGSVTKGVLCRRRI